MFCGRVHDGDVRKGDYFRDGFYNSGEDCGGETLNETYQDARPDLPIAFW